MKDFAIFMTITLLSVCLIVALVVWAGGVKYEREQQTTEITCTKQEA